ncbi:MAG: hypothetical protein Kow0077_24380 [Anaerolineae bacterium]
MKTCPTCGHENLAGVLFCENCGTSLIGLPAVGTTRGLDTELEPEAVERVVSAGSDDFLPGSQLRLEIEGSPDPIRIYPREELIFGRRDPATGAMPDIDLTPYAGYRMGVSRRHAAIRVSEDYHLDVWDLGSSNGTFLNGLRLNPHRPYRLRDGDRLRLGQMVIRVLFAPPQVSADDETLPSTSARVADTTADTVEAEPVAISDLGNKVETRHDEDMAATLKELHQAEVTEQFSLADLNAGSDGQAEAPAPEAPPPVDEEISAEAPVLGDMSAPPAEPADAAPSVAEEKDAPAAVPVAEAPEDEAGAPAAEAPATEAETPRAVETEADSPPEDAAAPETAVVPVAPPDVALVAVEETPEAPPEMPAVPVAEAGEDGSEAPQPEATSEPSADGPVEAPEASAPEPPPTVPELPDVDDSPSGEDGDGGTSQSPETEDSKPA